MATRTRFAASIRAQIVFERDARREGVKFRYELVGNPPNVRYIFPVEVPVYDERREAQALITDFGPLVHIDGPECLRHRYANGALCMWYPNDPPDAQWTPQDGLLSLIRFVREHAYCEAECRAGHPWPKPQSPGEHPRRRNCQSCLGQPSDR